MMSADGKKSITQKVMRLDHREETSARFLMDGLSVAGVCSVAASRQIIAGYFFKSRYTLL